MTFLEAVRVSFVQQKPFRRTDGFYLYMWKDKRLTAFIPGGFKETEHSFFIDELLADDWDVL